MKSVEINTHYHHKLSKLWKVVTREKFLKEWFFDVRNYSFEVGKSFTFYDSAGSEILHECTFTEIKEKEVVEYTWSYPELSPEKTKVRWEFLEDGEGTTIHFTHTELERFSDLGPMFQEESFSSGWNAFLNKVLKNYLNGIRKIAFSVDIIAKPDKVWNALFEPESYRNWTRTFSEDSHYKGEIKTGGRIHFLSQNNEGMYSDVLQLEEGKWIVFEHLGLVKAGEELPISEDVKSWTGSLELYRLIPTAGGTVVEVEVDVVPEHIDYMKDTFPKALMELKNICEL